MKDVQSRLSNPAVAVAWIAVLGTIVSGVCAFLGVVFAPAMRALLGL